MAERVLRLVLAFRRVKLWKRVAVLSLAAFSIFYFALWRTFQSDSGRWEWNYIISWHPSLRHVIPPGPWGTFEHSEPPIWIHEIYEAPHMSTWPTPQLSAPTYHSSGVDLISHGPPLYSSPSLLKLHIFSTIRNTSRPKRDIIRRLSPIYTIPEQYRHLVEVKFVMGKPTLPNGDLDVKKQAQFDAEQKKHGDLFQLDLKHGENLREGKILDWIRAVGDGEDGGRDSHWLFKMDDDTVLNMPKFLDLLVGLDASKPHYLGTSLNRWPPYHHHYTGLLTGFSWGVVKTLAAGIGKMSRPSIDWPRDDDVLTGEIMARHISLFDRMIGTDYLQASLPSGPQCDSKETKDTPLCDPRTPPTSDGWLMPPPIDPRTDLIRYDLWRRIGNHEVWFLKCDIAVHGGIYKSVSGWEEGWRVRADGVIWDPPPLFKHYGEGETPLVGGQAYEEHWDDLEGRILYDH